MSIAAFALVSLLCAARQQDEAKATLGMLRFASGSDTAKCEISCLGEKKPVDISRAAKAFRDHFMTTLVKIGSIGVVESEKVDEILTQRPSNDLVNPGDVRTVGKLLKAQYLLQGSLAMLRATVSQRDMRDSQTSASRTTEGIVVRDLRILDVASGKISMATSQKQSTSKSMIVSKGGKEAADADVNDWLAQAEHELVEAPVRTVIDAVYPIEVIRITGDVAVLDRGRDRLAVGDELLLVHRGEERLDPDTKGLRGFEETEIAKLKVVSADAKMVSTTAGGETRKWLGLASPIGGTKTRCRGSPPTLIRPPSKLQAGGAPVGREAFGLPILPSGSFQDQRPRRASGPCKPGKERTGTWRSRAR